MKERYTVSGPWIVYGCLSAFVEQTCELGTRKVIMDIGDVIFRAANRHVDREFPDQARWGASEPRMIYHGKS
jgi:hypothetical protein